MKNHFSLVELLVVTGCCAVLASMMLPTANRAREVALQAQCSSNLRQSAQAMISYSQGYDGWIQMYSDGYHTWWNAPGMPQEIGLNPSINNDDAVDRPLTACPSVVGPLAGWPTMNSYGVPVYWGEGFNDFNETAESEVEVTVGDPGFVMLRKNLLQDPSKYIILADAAYGPQFVEGTGRQRAGEPVAMFYRRGSEFALMAKRHMNNANAAYADGHVGDTTDRNRLWTQSKIGALVDDTGKNVEIISN